MVDPPQTTEGELPIHFLTSQPSKIFAVLGDLLESFSNGILYTFPNSIQLVAINNVLSINAEIIELETLVISDWISSFTVSAYPNNRTPFSPTS